MASSTDPSSAGARPSLWRHRNFRRYLTGQAASVTGSSISSMVIPVLAVLELDATTAEVAWLTFLGQLPPRCWRCTPGPSPTATPSGSR